MWTRNQAFFEHNMECKEKTVWRKKSNYVENMEYMPYNEVAVIVEFYETEKGDRPAQDFLDSLDYKMRCKMIGEIKLLCELGYLLRYPHSEKLTQHIFELRAKQGSNISHCLFFFDKGEKAILTHGFTKKTEKTPRREIDRAENLRTDYLTRRERCNHGK